MKNHGIGSTTAGAETAIDVRVQRNVVQINLHFFVPCLDVFFPLENLKAEIWLVRYGSSPDLYKNGATWLDFVFITSSLTSRGNLPYTRLYPSYHSLLTQAPISEDDFVVLRHSIPGVLHPCCSRRLCTIVWTTGPSKCRYRQGSRGRYLHKELSGV